jgi:hypothetical protein
MYVRVCQKGNTPLSTGMSWNVSSDVGNYMLGDRQKAIMRKENNFVPHFCRQESSVGQHLLKNYRQLLIIWGQINRLAD